MAFLVKGGEGSTASNPVLDLFTHISGILTDVYAAKFRIFDISSSDNRDTYYLGTKTDVQIFPITPGDYFNLDVNNLSSHPTMPGHKLSTGHYYAPFVPAESSNTGDFIIEWIFNEVMGGPDLQFCEEFVIVNEGVLTTGLNKIEKLKLFMQDLVSKNELLCGELEYTNQQYTCACEMAVMKFNCTTPVSNFTIENFPSSCEYLLMIGAVSALLRSTSILQLRNQLTYTDGNIHVGITDKFAAYQQLGQQYLQECDKMMRDVKNESNNAAAWGDSVSPYISIGYGYGGYYGGGWGWGDT